MRCLVSIGALVAALGSAAIAIAGIELELTRPDIQRAVKLARGSETQRARFHSAYQIPVTDDFIERLEVITEYRRMVILAEQHLAAGEWAFGISPRSAEDALRPWKQKVSIRAHIRFHPQNVYPMVPRVDISLGAGRDQLLPLRTMTDPQYAPGNHTAGSAPLIGALAEADFDAVKAALRTLDVAVHVQGGTELHRAVDFASMK